MLPEALARLYALAKRGARRSLDPIREACALEGDPQDRYASVHVAGTNGKGSVAASMESIARAAGLRTGLYTSPHLGKFAERIRVNGAAINDALLEEHLTGILDRHPLLTFFEVATLAAFQVFHQAHVELAIVEVGLGGRLDATNALTKPLATAITSIAFDHTEWLGDSIELIAAEKAGILKPGVPLVTGALPRAAAQVIEARAQEVGAAPVWRVGEELSFTPHFTPNGEHLVVQGPVSRSLSVTPALRGAHQRGNAAIAVGLAWLLRSPPPSIPPQPLEDVTIARGIATVQWPGRLETIETESGPVLLDGAHNEEGAHALAAEIDARPGRYALVFGAMGDKAWGKMVKLLARKFTARIYVAPVASGAGRNAAEPVSLVALDPGGSVAGNIADAIAMARTAVGRDGTVVVAGSLYLVGEARSLLLGEARDPQVGL